MAHKKKSQVFNSRGQLFNSDRHESKKFIFGWRFSDNTVGERQVNINFLYRLRKQKVMKFFIMCIKFDHIIVRLKDLGLIDYHSYHNKGTSVMGYFRITSLGLDYLTFSKL